MDKNLAAAAAVLEGGAGAGVAAGAATGVGAGAGAAAPAGAVANGGEVAAGAALGGGAGAAAAGAGAVADGAAAGGGAARTATEKEAIYKKIDAFYEANEYVEPCEYNTDDDVDEDNFESYVQSQLKKFESQKLKTLHRGRHVCPFCPYKVKDGLLASLEMHAMDTRHSAREWQGKADHEALARFVLGHRLPRSGRIPKRRGNI